MRILLAVDGSVSSDRATTLVASLAFPPDSVVRIVAAQQPYSDALAMSWAAMGDAGTNLESEEEVDARHLKEAVARAESTVAQPGLKVEGFLLHGRPGTAIVDEAVAFGADVVVLGSRGHGTIATMLLGSTAAEIVDHAPCPVLVARHTHLGPVAFADDGSPSARTAEGVFTRWPIFVGQQIDVITVAEVAVPVAAGFTPGLYDQVLDSYSRSADETRAEVAKEASGEAHRLAEAGFTTGAVALEGDAAAEIVRYAGEHEVGTIVMGTRGHTGLARLILGSVARNVLVHATCSVLIVREDKHK
ncbi:MAG: universal stress protein [Chloroflexota bacterium]